jgi:hypothetical protein
VADVAVGAPLNGIIEIAGPEKVGMSTIVQRYLNKMNDPRTVIPDEHARYFGAELNDGSLVPGPGARIGKINFETWFAGQLAKA